ncbi:thermonuclease family protein [Litorisediminicola beolgyonensis]|uniref:Thermonuclease family protein n=1 Tax=Litorisediminicola beolgyonensis TaxID=1173614 RepID=A0ABW3ZE28_9RHOB
MFRFCLLLSLLATPLVADPSGLVRVIDGDTFEVGGAKVRLYAIDAPERDQLCNAPGAPGRECGAWVTAEVRARFDGRDADCETVDRDRYGRIVARCRIGGADVGQALVSEGLAFAYRRYGMDYDLDEKAAAVAGRGLHAASVQTPADWRAIRRSAPAEAAPAGCAIKGNISGSGRIYHMPGQADYAATRIDEGRGERWFCSEDAARAAGWRRAKR